MDGSLGTANADRGYRLGGPEETYGGKAYQKAFLPSWILAR